MYCWKNISDFLVLMGISLLMISCGSSEEKNEAYEALDYKTRTRLRQYVNEGVRLYKQHCENCHQENGEGLASLYPPVKNSDYFIDDIPRAVCIMKNGQSGPVEVNGKSYNQPMPGNPRLTNLEIAEITTYLLYSMNDSVKIVTMRDVADYLEECSGEAIGN